MNVSPNNNDSLDHLGKFLMTHLRDSALDQFEGVATGHWKSPELQSLQQEVSEMSDPQRDTLRRCVRSAVDAGIHDFLFKIQEEVDLEGRVSLTVDDKTADQISDGLHGELFSEDGWIEQYSKHDE